MTLKQLIRNYDFLQFRSDGAGSLYHACLVRRFSAAVIDTLILLPLIIFVGIPEQHPLWGHTPIAGMVNSLLLFYYFLGPELMFRQSFGMWLMDLVVIAPHNREPFISLFFRKFCNLIEFALPSPIYFFFTSLSPNFLSLGDKTCGCFIVRKSILLGKKSRPKQPGKLYRWLSPILFTCLLPLFFICFIIIIMSPALAEPENLKALNSFFDLVKQKSSHP